MSIPDRSGCVPGFLCHFVSNLVQENKPVGFSVLRLVVTDEDSSHNGPPFVFTIVTGNDEKAFEVNQQGVLLTASAIKRKEKDHFLLQVKV